MRIAALIEATTITGPARNLLDFAVGAAVPDEHGFAEVEMLTFYRAKDFAAPADNQFLQAAHSRNLRTHVIREATRFDPRILSQLAATLRAIRPDIVQTHGVKSHFIAALLQLRGALPGCWVAFHHGYTAEDFKTLLYNKLNVWSLPRADRVVTVCSPFAEMLVSSGVRRERIDVLPNSIERRPPPAPQAVEDARAGLGLQDGQVVVLAVGRFSSEKGHEDLLRAFRSVRSRQPALPIRLVLVGDGILRQKLEKLASSLGIADSVIFAGHQRDVAPYYALTQLFVLPSHSEGSPNVLLEAMAAGLPIVSTRVGGVPDMVEHEAHALLTPPRQPGHLAAAMERMLLNPDLARGMARAAQLRVIESFQPGNYRASLLGIHERVLEG